MCILPFGGAVGHGLKFKVLFGNQGWSEDAKLGLKVGLFEMFVLPNLMIDPCFLQSTVYCQFWGWQFWGCSIILFEEPKVGSRPSIIQKHPKAIC